MNRERMHELADFLEELPQEKFDMNHWFVTKDPTILDRFKDSHIEDFDDVVFRKFDLDLPDITRLGKEAKGDYSMVCTTAACIAGWTCFLWPEEVDESQTVEKNAIRILNLGNWDAHNIFMSFNLDTQGAAIALRRFANEPEGENSLGSILFQESLNSNNRTLLKAMEQNNVKDNEENLRGADD